MKLVFFPSDPIYEYIKKGRDYKQLYDYYNPNHLFDEVYCLSPWGGNGLINGITYIKADPLKFRKIIKKIKPDVVRGYGGYWCSDWVSISKIKGIPTLVSVHDTCPDLIYDSLIYADYIIAMSAAVKKAILSKIPYDENRIIIMPNRVDTNIFQKKNDILFFQELNRKYGECRHILHVGRKTEQKNLDVVIKSLVHLPQYSCVFIGVGDTEKYENMARNLGVLNRCYFLQSVPNKELPLWYSWADVFVTPSKWEGFGIVFIEAASTESTIITSNLPPMNEFLKNRENSILVDDYDDPKEIVEAVLELENNKVLRDKISKNARMVGLKFDKKIIDKQEADIYRTIISTKTGYSINRKKIKEMRIKRIKYLLNYLCKRLKVFVTK